MSIDILIPTYNRPDRVTSILLNVRTATAHDHDVWFIVEEEDEATIAEVRGNGLEPIINKRTRSYSGAINTAYEETSGEFLFAGADDLTFQAGWDAEALKVMSDPWVGVVGTMDGVNPYVMQGYHATHYLVRRSYLDIWGGIVDLGPRSFLFEGYGHNYTDTEFIGTAKMRAKFHPCFTSHVRHNHWSTGAMRPDSTTDKANATYGVDSALYDSRRDLWFNISR